MQLEVICINDKGNNRLIKGQKYIVTALYELHWKQYINHNGIDVKIRRINIKGMSSYGINRFKSVDGRNFYDIPLFKNDSWINRIDNNKDYTGQYVLCRWDGSSKYLKNGEIYLVKEHRKEKNVHSIVGKFKLEGLNRCYYNTRNFNEIPIKEQRKVKLQNISGEEIKTGVDKRKFLFYSKSEKLRIILEVMVAAMKNMKGVKDRKNINIIDFMVKAGNKYNIIEEDITFYLNTTLKKLLKDGELF